jgi:hypothetical protein
MHIGLRKTRHTQCEIIPDRRRTLGGCDALHTMNVRRRVARPRTDPWQIVRGTRHWAIGCSGHGCTLRIAGVTLQHQQGTSGGDTGIEQIIGRDRDLRQAHQSVIHTDTHTHTYTERPKRENTHARNRYMLCCGAEEVTKELGTYQF